MTTRRPDRADIEAALAQIAAVSEYDLKIKAHLEAVLSREAVATDALNTAERQLFSVLPVAVSSEDALAKAIREGAVTASAKLVAALREQALARLAIDNPAYSSYRKYR